MGTLKKVAILQSNYIPWKGYFDIIGSVDEFIIYDDVQYTRRDWRNRNLIKTPQGAAWLTIPVKVKGRYDQKIGETVINGRGWAARHWKSIVHSYGRCKHFGCHEVFFAELYAACADCNLLSEVNSLFIRKICRVLGITTKISSSADYSPGGKKSSRILSICRQAGADVYLTGPAGLGYLDTEQFRSEGIVVAVADYSGYPVYDQPWPPFLHNVSIADLMFCTGARAPDFMKRML